ncbi:MAG: hypothetical protein AB7V42_14315 [Thermoleophilia bacterium]
MRVTRLRLAIIPLAIAAVALAAGCGSDDDSGAASTPAATSAPATTPAAPSAAAATVSTASGPLGTYLVGPDGRTLYLWEADSGSTSTCNDACAGAWPPLLTDGAPMAAGEARADLLGTSTRDDGATMVTYAGHPLYYFVRDGAPGDTAGQGSDGFGADWYVVAPDGKAIEG